MNRVFSLVVIFFAAAIACSQGSIPAQAQTSAETSHGAFPVKVSKTLDSSKVKEGDAVEVETIGSFKLPDGTLIPKGSKLIGHVLSAKARSKGDSESQLAISFDHLDLAKNKQLTLKGTVQAVFPPADQVDASIPFSSMAKGSVGSITGPGYQPTDVKSGANTETKAANIDPAVDPKSSGVHGIRGVSLEKGVLRTDGKQVKLNGGIRMIIRAEFLDSPTS